MSYIEKEKLIKADIASIENRVRHAFNQGYDLGFKDGKKGAKSLEQEPVLEKIRAEIAEYGSIWVEYKITGRKDMDIEQLVSNVLKQAKKQVLEVIDKYKAEIEPQESEG